MSPRFSAALARRTTSTFSSDTDMRSIPRRLRHPDQKDEMAMIDHVGVEVGDLAASRDFYAAALAPLGVQPLMDFEGVACRFGYPLGKFACKPFVRIQQRARPAVGGAHVAFSAASCEEVD